MQTPKTILLATAFSGVATHVFIFSHGEWHMQAPLIFRFYITLALLITIFAISKDGVQGAGTSSAVIITYALSFFVSMGFYRAVLHRLRKFPGPFWAGISKFWHVAKCIRSSSQNHKVLDKLHKKYGDFVRTGKIAFMVVYLITVGSTNTVAGPSEVTVFHPDVFNVMDGPGNHCTKAVWYDFLLPEVAVNTTRDKPLHDQRRRIWDSGFNSKALVQYQQRIAHFAIHMDAHIEKCAKENEVVDIADWVYWYSFDVMGEFAFARSFDMLRDQKWHHAIVLLRRAMSLLGPLSPVPWLAQIGFWLIPNFWRVKDWNTMMRWCRTRMEERIGVRHI
jgi:tryprostatin B 6-hydroxylase